MDLLRAYFLHGEPKAALSYQSAIPYQDRFVYMLIGAELYLLAHELAHVILEHISASRGRVITAEQEVEADDLALQIVEASFSEDDEFSAARAVLSGALFHSLNQVWEDVVRGAIARGSDFGLGNHPPASERWEQFVDQSVKLPRNATPGWFQVVWSGLIVAAQHLPRDLVATLVAEADALGGLHARVLPSNLTHLGRSTPLNDAVWAQTIAGLIVSDDEDDRLLGLWFGQTYNLAFFLPLYLGVISDDDWWCSLSQRTLKALEPMYDAYMPSLVVKLQQAEDDETVFDYVASVSVWLLSAIAQRLGERRLSSNPLDQGFFDQ